MITASHETTSEALERQRVKAVKATGLLDGKRDPSFDRITQLLAKTYDCKTALLSLMDADRQYFLSNFGSDVTESARNISFCNHVVEGGKPVFVEDAKLDPRFRDHPYVTQGSSIRSYLGVPLELSEGIKVGSVCIADPRPARFSREQIPHVQMLADIARDVITSKISETLAKKARHALDVQSHKILAQNRLLESAEQIAKVGSWAITTDLQTLKWSKQTYAMHEVPNGTKINVAKAINFYAPKDRELVSASLYKVLKDRTRFTFKADILTTSGKMKRVVCVGDFIAGCNWVDDRIIGVIREITD